MTKKRLKQILSQVPANYYEKGVRTNFLQKYWHTKKWHHLGEFLTGVESTALLDIGCADGTTTRQLQKILPDARIVGVDYYKKAIDFAKKKKSKIKFVHADVHDLPFANNSFDTVTAIETLEHLTIPERVLDEIRRVLKPRGYLIIGQDTDSILFRTIWFAWTKWKGSVWENSHINCMKPKDLIRILKKQGFKIENSKTVNFGMEIFIRARKK